MSQHNNNNNNINNNTHDESLVLLVAVGDGQSKVCQETNRLFKYLRIYRDAKPEMTSAKQAFVLPSKDEENRAVLISCIHDLLNNFWYTLIINLFNKQTELEQKHIILDSVFDHLKSSLERVHSLSLSSSSSSSSTTSNTATNDDDEDEQDLQQLQRRGTMTGGDDTLLSQLSSIFTLDMVNMLMDLWNNHPLIRRMFNNVDTDEFIQSILDESIYSQFEYKTCESMIHYLMNDFLPRIKNHLSNNKSSLAEFVCNETDFIFSSYKPVYRDLLINVANNKNIILTTINHETKETINVTDLLSKCSLLVFNFDLAIYCRNDLHEIVDMFCAKSRYENMTTHESFTERPNNQQVPPVVVMRSGLNNMHMNLGRHGLGMLPSEMFSEALNFLAPEKIRAPKLYRSPNVTFKQWDNDQMQQDGNGNDASGGARFEELSEDEWSQVIKFVGNPDDMLSLSHSSTTLRYLIERNDDFWKDAMIGKSTNYMREKKTKAYEQFVKMKQQEVNGDESLPVTWRDFYLYAIQEVHKSLAKEICNFIMLKNALSYVTGDREKKLPDESRVKLLDADAMNLAAVNTAFNNLFALV